MEQKDLKDLEKAVSKGMLKGKMKSTLLTVIITAVVTAFLMGGFSSLINRNKGTVEPVEGHDLTLENNGIFGYLAADFSEVVLGQAKKESKLIVEQQDASVVTTMTDAGLFNLSVFSKTQSITYFGTGTYVVDLAKLKASDLTLDESTYTLTMKIDHPYLDGKPVIDFEKTVVSDADRGLLAFGDIQMNADQTNKVQAEGQQLLTDKFNEKDSLAEADRFALLSVWEVYQPLVETLSPACKLIVKFKD